MFEVWRLLGGTSDMGWFGGREELSAGPERLQQQVQGPLNIFDAYGAPADSVRTQKGCTEQVQGAIPEFDLFSEVGAFRRYSQPMIPWREEAPKLSAACMQVSVKGMQLVQFYEGLRLQVYQDHGEQRAIGYGHHVKPGEDFSKGISKAHAEHLLRRDLRSAVYHVTDKVKVPVSQGQYDALVSFVFNVGSRNFERSNLLRRLNNGDYEGAANEFRKWTKAGSPAKTLPGLVARRAAEKGLFTSAL
jgi:lysozyme